MARNAGVGRSDGRRPDLLNWCDVHVSGGGLGFLLDGFNRRNGSRCGLGGDLINTARRRDGQYVLESRDLSRGWRRDAGVTVSADHNLGCR
jgi:hypothetical protein